MQLGGMKIQKCCMNNIFDVTVWHENLHWLVLFHTWRDFHVLSWHALKMFDVNEKHVSSHDGWHLPRELHLKLRGKMAPDVTFMNWHQIAFTADMYTKSTFWCLLACKKSIMFHESILACLKPPAAVNPIKHHVPPCERMWRQCNLHINSFTRSAAAFFLTLGIISGARRVLTLVHWWRGTILS